MSTINLELPWGVRRGFPVPDARPLAPGWADASKSTALPASAVVEHKGELLVLGGHGQPLPV